MLTERSDGFSKTLRTETARIHEFHTQVLDLSRRTEASEARARALETQFWETVGDLRDKLENLTETSAGRMTTGMTNPNTNAMEGDNFFASDGRNTMNVAEESTNFFAMLRSSARGNRSLRMSGHPHRRGDSRATGMKMLDETAIASLVQKETSTLKEKIAELDEHYLDLRGNVVVLQGWMDSMDAMQAEAAATARTHPLGITAATLCGVKTGPRGGAASRVCSPNIPPTNQTGIGVQQHVVEVRQASNDSSDSSGNASMSSDVLQRVTHRVFGSLEHSDAPNLHKVEYPAQHFTNSAIVSRVSSPRAHNETSGGSSSSSCRDVEMGCAESGWNQNCATSVAATSVPATVMEDMARFLCATWHSVHDREDILRRLKMWLRQRDANTTSEGTDAVSNPTMRQTARPLANTEMIGRSTVSTPGMAFSVVRTPRVYGHQDILLDHHFLRSSPIRLKSEKNRPRQLRPVSSPARTRLTSASPRVFLAVRQFQPVSPLQRSTDLYGGDVAGVISSLGATSKMTETSTGSAASDQRSPEGRGLRSQTKRMTSAEMRRRTFSSFLQERAAEVCEQTLRPNWHWSGAERKAGNHHGISTYNRSTSGGTASTSRVAGLRDHDPRTTQHHVDAPLAPSGANKPGWQRLKNAVTELRTVNFNGPRSAMLKRPSSNKVLVHGSQTSTRAGGMSFAAVRTSGGAASVSLSLSASPGNSPMEGASHQADPVDACHGDLGSHWRRRLRIRTPDSPTPPDDPFIVLSGRSLAAASARTTPGDPVLRDNKYRVASSSISATSVRPEHSHPVSITLRLAGSNSLAKKELQEEMEEEDDYGVGDNVLDEATVGAQGTNNKNADTRINEESTSDNKTDSKESTAPVLLLEEDSCSGKELGRRRSSAQSTRKPSVAFEIVKPTHGRNLIVRPSSSPTRQEHENL
ncbi:unnamed protein product [Amoebophrya sp. A25]|nr:unnamed protein product [Amoebophrya sp. A25]|eukprot:GSA25T00011342001.1